MSSPCVAATTSCPDETTLKADETILRADETKRGADETTARADETADEGSDTNHCGPVETMFVGKQSGLEHQMGSVKQFLGLMEPSLGR